VLRIAADIDICALLQPIVELASVLAHAILNLNLVLLIARERELDTVQQTALAIIAPFRLVQESRAKVPLAEGQPILSARALSFALGDEAAEGSDTRARTDHDDGQIGVGRQSEVRVAMQIDRGNRIVAFHFGELFGRDAKMSSAVELEVNESDREVDLVRRRASARGDGIKPRRERTQESHEVLGAKRLGRMLAKKLTELHARRDIDRCRAFRLADPLEVFVRERPGHEADVATMQNLSQRLL